MNYKAGYLKNWNGKLKRVVLERFPTNFVIWICHYSYIPMTLVVGNGKTGNKCNCEPTRYHSTSRLFIYLRHKPWLKEAHACVGITLIAGGAWEQWRKRAGKDSTIYDVGICQITVLTLYAYDCTPRPHTVHLNYILFLFRFVGELILKVPCIIPTITMLSLISLKLKIHIL